MYKSLVLLAGLSVLLSGCASSIAKSMQGPINFAPEPDKAVIFVYRDGGMAGNGRRMPIRLDQQKVGSTINVNALRIVTSPGHHEISSKAENTATVALDTEAGKVYYVHQTASVGMLGSNTSLEVVDEATGHAGTDKCILVPLSATPVDQAGQAGK